MRQSPIPRVRVVPYAMVFSLWLKLNPPSLSFFLLLIRGFGLALLFTELQQQPDPYLLIRFVALLLSLLALPFSSNVAGLAFL